MAYDEDLIKNPKGECPASSKLCVRCAIHMQDALGTLNKPLKRSHPTQSKRPMRSQTQSNVKIGPNFVESWGICYCSRSITRKWPRKQAI